MKIYEGTRGLSGADVTVDGVPLPSRDDIKVFTRTGMEWGFIGPGPQQLALALLADHFGDDERALALCHAFMRRVTSLLDNAWRLTTADMAEEVTNIGPSR